MKLIKKWKKFLILFCEGMALLVLISNVCFSQPIWTLADHTPPTTVTLCSAAYGNGHYVVVGSYGVIKTSTDHIHWILQNSGTENSLNSVIFANGNFIAVGGNGTILTSPDGMIWTPKNACTKGHLTSVIYADSQFVSIDANNTILTSPDGSNWTCQDLGDTLWLETNHPYNYLNSITYGNNQFIAVGGYKYMNGGGYDISKSFISTSRDGKVWQKTDTNVSLLLYHIAFGNNVYVATSSISYNLLYYSTDGRIWNSGKMPAGAGSAFFSSVQFCNGQFLIYGTPTIHPSGCIALTSTDGLTWSNNYYASGYSAYNDTKEYFFTKSGFKTDSLIFIFGDSGIWGIIPDDLGAFKKLSVNFGLHHVCYADSQFIAVGKKGTVLTSPNGSKWTAKRSPTIQNFNSSAYGNNRFVCVGNGDSAFSLIDDSVWIKSSLGASHHLNSITFSNNQFITVGDSGAILISPDGETWSFKASGTTENLKSIAFGNSHFVVVGDGDTVLSSTDGISWIKSSTGLNGTLKSILFNNGQFIAAGFPDIL